ncbi:ATP-binding protein [Cerasicoccus frondis]|uniref:ATP-binding protein n=1 Tax=Cerasicoccus frondis TaxID=490090 RepID=UPI002852DA9F|nr:ATP-binding protein [Cerasicoccus frondis]
MRSSGEDMLFNLERAAFQLQRLEVFNWGPFSGMHAADIDAQGTAIIGMTGSGKTTLVDGFVTLIAEQPKYNLASTGGHESDRSLISYVRGVVGSGNDSGDSAHISRKGKTTTGICATYSDGQDELRLGAIMWIDGGSFSPSDLKRAWIFSRDPRHSLEQWLAIHSQGGLRLLKQQLRDDNEAQIFDASTGGKRAYLARVRSFFEVADNAFALLNRAAGLKQLNSIDDIFRNLVLDDHAQFDRAAEVASEFDNLAEIHAELETAQRQQQSLWPVEKQFDAYEQHRIELERKRRLASLLPVWFALEGKRRWQTRAVELEADFRAREKALREAEEQVRHAGSEVETLYEKYVHAGGGDVESLRKLIEANRKEAARRRDQASEYQATCRLFELPLEIDAETFAETQRRAEAVLERLMQDKETAGELAYRRGAAVSQIEADAKDLRAEYNTAKDRPTSNIPGAFQRIRDLLASELELSPEALPFVGELVQVLESEQSWRGAIERALGGNRLRLLVPKACLRAALRWVNAHQHGLHIRLLEADPEQAPNADFFADGYLRKLEFKQHPLREAMKGFLASYDLHCVDSTDALGQTPHGLTREGLMSGKRGLFEKKDQRRLEQDWCTGFSNRDRLADLTKQLEEASAKHDAAAKAFQAARAHHGRLEEQTRLVEGLRKLDFEAIDYPSQEAEILRNESKLQELTDPESDAGKALQVYEAAKKRKEKLEAKAKACLGAAVTAEGLLKSAQQRIEACNKSAGDGLSFEDQRFAEEHLTVDAQLKAEGLAEEERRRAAELAKAIQQGQDNQTNRQTNLVRAMEHAKLQDTGALAEAGTELADIPAYLERLRVLTDEALPDKRKRFLKYLTKSSDQGVTQLLAAVNEEVTRIKERIDDLNESLESVDFKQGRYLRLTTQNVVHDNLRGFERAHKQLRAAALRQDDHEGHFKALQHIVQLLRDAVDKKHTVGARALLDPRFRLEFHGLEIDRETDAVVERFKGSQGGSGGEKEIIASYILTASLCYALSPEGGRFPLHSTIVLDEAFSKSSRAVANRIVNALREFKLHPIFVTPNKEMRLLRQHTRSVVYVHRKDARATLASISWRELESRVEHRNGDEPTLNNEPAAP